MNIVLGIPYYDTIMPETTYSLLCAALTTQHHISISMAGGPQIAQNREAIVSEALEAKADRLVFIDSDIAFPPEALDRLVGHDLAIVGGAYNLKRLPRESAMKIAGPDGSYLTGELTLPDHPIAVSILPAGFLSIDVRVVSERLTRPWFYNHIDACEIVTEDVTFCRSAVDAGLDLWCDPTIPIRHIGRFAY